MFEPYSEQEKERQTPKEKNIYLIMNGFPDKLFTYQFKRSMLRQDFQRACERNWGANKYKNMRLFSIDGVQIMDDDLLYVRDGDRIYVSKGEEYDSNSNFGEYQLIKVLGEGGFGKVSLGRNTITNQFAAIKVIKLEKIFGANDIDMIFREIQNLKALSHPNIVKILNCYTLTNMQVVVVMEYLEGGELLQKLKQKGRFEEDYAKKIFKQICSAVNYCHQHNIIHRDLKLENILLKNVNDDKIKVADFGISGVADRFNPDVDTGTLKYMSPQVLSRKQKSNTPAVDVWACGVMLYFMLYGILPFSAGSSSQIVKVIVGGKFTFPKLPVISEECKFLIQMMMEVNPKKRIKMCEIQDSLWMMSSPNKNKTELDDPVLEIIESKKDVLREAKKPILKTKYMKIPMRLEKQKQKIMQELEGYGAEHRRMHKSEAKPLSHVSQQLPSINSYLRNSRSRNGQQGAIKRKRTSFISTNMWK